MRSSIFLAISLFAGVAGASDREEYRAYREAVDRETAKTWRENKQLLDPLETRGRARGIDLDHIKPVKQCYLEGLSPQECASVGNLRLMDARLNRREGCRSACGR